MDRELKERFDEVAARLVDIASITGREAAVTVKELNRIRQRLDVLEDRAGKGEV